MTTPGKNDTENTKTKQPSVLSDQSADDISFLTDETDDSSSTPQPPNNSGSGGGRS